MIHPDWFWDPSGKWYVWWSGLGGDLAYLAVLVGLWRGHNCHTRGCWRLARHPVADTPYRVCRHHHPDVPNAGPSAADIAASR